MNVHDDEDGIMQIGRVKGKVVATKKSERITGWKLLLVQPIDLDTFKEKGSVLVAADLVGADCGEVVMLTSGSPARQTPVTDGKPVDLIICAIIDAIQVKGERIFEKHR